MKRIVAILLSQCTFMFLSAQTDEQRKTLTDLVDQYSKAREQRDTVLLKKILSTDVDQLVSTGEWRTGIRSAIDGMLKSSSTNPGKRTLTVDKIQMLDKDAAIVDCRYEIQNADGSMRRMWSTFVVVADKKEWRIRAIRNMLPAAN